MTRTSHRQKTAFLFDLDGTLVEAFITRDQVAYAKPEPDLFLAAADRLGVPIDTATVVGDSVWDMLASRRARALGIYFQIFPPGASAGGEAAPGNAWRIAKSENSPDPMSATRQRRPPIRATPS